MTCSISDDDEWDADDDVHGGKLGSGAVAGVAVANHAATLFEHASGV